MASAASIPTVLPEKVKVLMILVLEIFSATGAASAALFSFRPRFSNESSVSSAVATDFSSSTCAAPPPSPEKMELAGAGAKEENENPPEKMLLLINTLNNRCYRNNGLV